MAVIPEYVNAILGKLGQKKSTSYADTLYTQSFHCRQCAHSTLEAIQSKMNQLGYHSYHVLPPCENLGIMTGVVQIFDWLVFTFELGPVVPVLVTWTSLEKTKKLVLDLYSLPVFSDLTSEWIRALKNG